MAIDLQTALMLVALIAPFATFWLMRRTRERSGWLAWLAGLLGSSAIGWLSLIGAVHAKAAELEAAYELNPDEAILRRLTQDTSSGMLIYFGGFFTLFWSINVLGTLAIISHFRRRFRAKPNLAIQSFPTLRQKADSVHSLPEPRDKP